MANAKAVGRRNVAIIGYGVRLPGGTGREAFWRLLSEGGCAVSQVPPDRFPTGSFYHPHAGAEVPGRSYTFAAALIDNVWDFDPGMFGISPREAAQIDPQQRHLLEVTYEAIEHAGLRPSGLAGENIGVYVGASSSDHAARFMFDPSAVDMHMMTGNTLSLLSNRLSYTFDLRGPSFTVDTACSSSLVAMHLALEAIREGKVDTAIVGGVNMLLSPFSFLGFSRASMLSPTGLCRAFDASGDGYVRGEGAVTLVLRSEDAARRNGDRMHALVVGSGTNQDGRRTVGLSLPSADAQAALLKHVYDVSGVAPDDLAFVEAHGTGTKVGDPAEAEALGRVLGKRRVSPLPIGSVKTNIGHLEPASGLAGVVKSIMALEHEVLPASLHFNEPNPDISFDELNLRVAAEALAIPKGRRPRYASINSFGFGGSNAHVLLRESEPVAPTRCETQAPLIISAHDTASLKTLADRFAELMQHGDAASIANAAAHSRDRLPERMIIANPLHDRFPNGGPGVWQGSALGTDLDVAFVFSGNGAQWAGMGLVTYKTNEAFRRALARFDECFTPIAGWSVVAALHSSQLPIEIRRASCAQPLLLAIQVAIVEALRERGLDPSAAIGHSVGEIAAAWCAGALDIEGAIRVVLARSQRQEITRYRGAMAAVLVSANDMQVLLDHGAFPQLEIAAINSSRSVTVAAPRQTLDAFLRYAEQERWGVRRLDLDYPFHCALVDSIQSQLIEDLDGLEPTSSRIPFVSTVTGKALAGEELDGRYWWRNVREPVNFAGGIRTLIDSGNRMFLEIGPHSVLGGYMHEALRSSSVQGAAISTLSRDPSGESDEILGSAARVLIAGGRVDNDRFVGPAQRPAMELPNYAWQHRRFKIEQTREAFSTFGEQSHPLLGQATRYGSGTWHATVDPLVLPWLGDHRIEDAAVFPAAGFIEVALAVARETFGDVALEVRDLEILQPLVFDSVRSFEIETRLSFETHTLEMRSRPALDDFALNARATIARAPVSEKPDRFMPLVETSFDAGDVYGIAERRGLFYGPAFRRIAAVEIVDARQARAVLGSPPTRVDEFVLDPTALDAAFHILIALAESDPVIDPDALLLPVRAGSLRVYRPGAVVASASVRVTSSTPRSQVADFLLFDQAGALVAELRDARCRVVSRSLRETPDDLVYCMGFEALHRASLPSAFAEVCVDGPARALFEAARSAGHPAEQRDVALLLEAGARAAAYEAIRSLTGPDESLSLADLVARDKVALSACPLLIQMLLALADAGLVREQGDGWTLDARPDAPTIAELVDVLVTRYPSWIAEATCLARLPELLPSLIRDGLDQGLGFSQAVIEHLERGSPAFTHHAEVTYQGAVEVLKRWPVDRPLRVLVIGAVNLPLAARLGRTVPRAVVVVADPRSEFLDTARRSAFSHERLRMTPWEQAVDRVSGYDLILGAGSLNRVVAAPGRFDMMVQTLRTGGALIAVEPLPSLFTDLVYGQTPDWWSRSVSPEFPTGTIMLERDWSQTLQDAGLTDETAQAIDGGVLISAVNTKDRIPSAADVVSRSMMVVADAEGQTFADLLHQRLQHAARVVPLHAVDGRSQQQRVRKVALADVASEFRSGHPITDIVFVAHARTTDVSVEALTRPLLEMIQLATAARRDDRFCLWIVCSGALSGIADDRSPNPIQTGLWMAARVIQNEFPEIDVRCLDLDPQLALDAAASRAAEAVAHPSADREVMLGANGEAALRVLRGGLLTDRADGDVVRLEFAQAGVFDSFIWRPKARAVLAPGEVEIAVTATGLNFRDVMWSLGLLPDEALENGFTGPAIGMECSGLVSAVGAEVQNLRVGDRVVAFASGGFASSIVMDSRMATRLPDDISLESAATLPVAFLTAHYALVHLAQLQPGETVLIHGGAGGVGLAALQIARLRGAKVIATAGSADRRTLLRALGADHVFDSRSLSFADEIQRVCGGVDVVLNSLAGEAMERSVGCLKPFGRFLELGKRDFYEGRHLGLRPFRNNLSYFGIDADQLLLGHRALTQRMFAELMDMFANGLLTPLPYRLFDGENASDAFRLMQRSGQVGKILIRPPQSRPRMPVASGFEIDPRGQYLIVGGLGGFGFATAQWLASKGARHLALMSRTGHPSPECAGEIAVLKASGITVDVVAVDVTDAAALERYFWTLDGGPPLKGVFHAAMVLDDGFAADLNRSRIEPVLRPKVAGAANLDRLTRRFDLDCFVLYSSVAAMIGNVGQSSYAAANGYLDGLARRRRAEGLPALAVGFGAIGDVGYLARNEQVGEVLSQQLGRSKLSATEALAGLEALLQCDPYDVNAASVVFARLDWALARKELKLVRSPLFSQLQLDEMAADVSLAAAELLLQLRDMPDIEVQAKLADLIGASIVRTLRLPVGEIDRNRALSEFGMDSLMMLELRVAVEEQMGIEIPLMSLTASLTISEISKRLTGILRSQDKVLMSGQMSVLAQEHVEIPAALSEAEVAATAAAVARRAKSVGRIL